MMCGGNIICVLMSIVVGMWVMKYVRNILCVSLEIVIVVEV